MEPSFARADLAALVPPVHGSVSLEELRPLGLTPAEVTDFSVSINPLGPSPIVLDALASARWDRYPGDDEKPLKELLAVPDGLSPQQVVLGNGSSALIWSIALAVCGPRDLVEIVSPTFGEYARAATVAGAHIRFSRTPEGSGARLLFLCNPNNPTGGYRDRSEIERLLESQPDCLVVVDEAYAVYAVASNALESLLAYPNLVLLRSLTKSHAVPGLRLGYALMQPRLARAVELATPPWSINSGALRVGLACLTAQGQAHAARGASIVRRSRAYLTRELTGLGYVVHPSAANFILVQVGNGAQFRQRLLAHGLVVRDCASFGLPDHVRVACLQLADCERLVEAIRGLDAQTGNLVT